MIKLFLTKHELSFFSKETEGEIEGYFLTAQELEQLQREAFQAGINAVHPPGYSIDFDFEDYLSSKSKEGRSE